jgi:hypothetical protein
MVMSTFDEIKDEVVLKLAGFGVRNQTFTHLTGAVASGSTQISVANAGGVSRGLVEIDDELIWVDSFDRTTNVLQVPPYGRGYYGTSAAAHTVNSKVTVNPVFPRTEVGKAVNTIIRAVGKKLFAVKTATFTYSPAVTNYALPADVDNILSISFQAIGPSKEWVPVRVYRLDKSANIAAMASTKTVNIKSYVDSGATVQVTYSAKPDVFEFGNDDFETVTGLSASIEDVIVTGACYHLLSFVEPGRFNFRAADSAASASGIEFGAGTNLAKYVYALFQQRLSEEQQKLLDDYPSRISYNY